VNVNVDTSFDDDSLRGTTSVVIYDNSRSFMAEYNKTIDHAFGVLTAETSFETWPGVSQSIGYNCVIMNSNTVV
jgi:hypothetical protein